jgi:hypothetical protein
MKLVTNDHPLLAVATGDAIKMAKSTASILSMTILSVLTCLERDLSKKMR